MIMGEDVINGYAQRRTKPTTPILPYLLEKVATGKVRYDDEPYIKNVDHVMGQYDAQGIRL